MNNHCIKFYVNSKWKRRGVHTPFLNPWWGNPYEEASIFSKQMFDNYSFDTSYYSITDNIEISNMILAPYNHNWLLKNDRNLLSECINIANLHNLPLLIDGSGDIEYPITDKDVYILRYGGYRFLSSPNNIQIPLITDDLLERCCHGEFILRKKSEGKPIVGFAGWARLTPKQYIKTIIKELPLRLKSIPDSRYLACIKGVLWRRKIIDLLKTSQQIVFNLHARSSFSASPKTAEGDMKKLQQEMVNTILQSDYALDVRGDANNSARLFEILSLGRIPIIVDTERNLPFSNLIDYSSFALIVDFRDIHNLPDIIINFHKNISVKRFEEMQKKARNVFVNYFRIDAMMRYIVEDLRNKILNTK